MSTDEAIAASRNPSHALRTLAAALHDELFPRDGKYPKTYDELERTDQIGFGEFNSAIAAALDRAGYRAVVTLSCADCGLAMEFDEAEAPFTEFLCEICNEADVARDDGIS